ncbi:MAG: J domain-containing protein [Desulfobacteraceae bacterium]|nr:MAG: J domain-containing protein [Desulfobacteraceae bacterium]
MYLALKRNRDGISYVLRESYPENDEYLSRDLYDVGPDPGRLILYPGGNSFYVDPAVSKSIRDKGLECSSDELEEIFWPFVDQRIRSATEHFRKSSRSSGTFRRLSRKEKLVILSKAHPFDKRRVHFLKFGNMNQGPLERMPALLFKKLVHQSRDEIEQGFLAQEGILKPHELKSYIYTIFDLQRFFQSFMAKSMPHVLDQEKVETHFLEQICRINRELFKESAWLDNYLVRYVYLFFDGQYADTKLLDEMAQDFIFRHRFFKQQPRPEKQMPMDESLAVFNLTKEELSTLSRRALTRLYRKIASTRHPDTGGSHQEFIELNNAYQTLLEKIQKQT